MFFRPPKAWLERKSIRAVLEDDLQAVLKDLELLELIEQGEASCHICGRVISLENLQALFRSSGTIHFVCNTPGCYERLVIRVEESQC